MTAPSSLTPLPSAADPRILVLSAAVPQTWYAGSLLLYRLLQHYPADRLKAVGPVVQPASEVLACDYAALRPAASSRLNLTRLAEINRSLQNVFGVGLIPQARVDRAVGQFRANVVVTVMERLDYVEAAHRYCRRHRVPLVLIVHDRLESFDRVYGPFKAAQRRRIAAIYRDAAVRFCISPEMEQCLAREYGAPGTVLYPNRSEELTPRPAAESVTLKEPPKLTVAYAGAMSYGYGERLRELMPTLAKTGMQLRLFSRDELVVPIPGVAYAGAFRHPKEIWERIKSECDAVWLPYSHHPEMRSLYETHFPSKLTEYLALGMPVLITGPEYATGVRWGLRNPAATLTVAGPSGETISAAVTRLRDDAALRLQLASTVTDAGNADFDPQMIRQRFLENLRAAATAP